MDDTELGTQKFQDFQEGQLVAAYAGFQSLLIQNLEEFYKFGRLSMNFLEFRSKFKKFGENLRNSSRAHKAFITGFSISSMGVCGYFLEWPIINSSVR